MRRFNTLARRYHYLEPIQGVKNTYTSVALEAKGYLLTTAVAKDATMSGNPEFLWDRVSCRTGGNYSRGALNLNEKRK